MRATFVTAISLLFLLMNTTSFATTSFAYNAPYSALTAQWLSSSHSSVPTSTTFPSPVLYPSNTTGGIATPTTSLTSYSVSSFSSSHSNITSTLSNQAFVTATGLSGSRIGNYSSTAVYTYPTVSASSTGVQVYAGVAGQLSASLGTGMAMLVAMVGFLHGI